MNYYGLRYDSANMWAKAVGKTGAAPAEWKGMLKRLRIAKKNVQKIARTKEQGFLDLPFDRKGQAEAILLARKMSRKFSDLIVLGIGGSDLGARAIQQALVDPSLKKQKGMRVHFAGSSADPEELIRLLKNVNLRNACINIVSKSGNTVEPMTAFTVLYEKLKKHVGAKNAPKQIVATTDPTSGVLRAMAKAEGFATLSIPRNVGGRFSVLSSVGLFPAAAMGIDVTKLISGARAAVDLFHENAISECPACEFAGLHVLGAEKRKQRTQITMPYSSRLTEFGRWVRQLVAESLGKKRNRRGKTVHAGLTPESATGPEDQHSQLQLWSEGPADKQITFIEIERFGRDVRIPGDHTIGKLDHQERAATAEALRLVGRPNGTIFIPKLDAAVLGELFVFFELTVALMGELFDVNAYDQPGVETMKRILKEKRR